MKTASHNPAAGTLGGATPGRFFHGIHIARPMPLAAEEPHAKRQALSKALFTLARLAPAMLWLGNFGWNR